MYTRPPKELAATVDVVASPLPGPSGNVEYFLHLRADAGPVDPEIVRRAIEEGPQ